MIEDDIEDDADAGLVKGCHGIADFGKAAGCEARIGRHEVHRIIAPGVGEAQIRKVTLVDPGGERHQFQRVDAELQEVRNDCRFGQCRDGAALGLRNREMQPGEGFHLHLIDQAGNGWWQRAGVFRCCLHHAFRHESGGFEIALGEDGMMGIWTVEACRVRIGEQLGHVEAVALCRVPWPIGAQAITGARRYAADSAVANIAQAVRQGEAIEFGFSSRIEDTEMHQCGMARNNRDVGAIAGQRYSKRRGRAAGFREMTDQVITVGAARPVRFSICGMDRESATRSANASWVSMPWRATSGS